MAISSTSIKVFPSVNRAKTNSDYKDSRILGEANLIGLITHITDYDSFVVSSSKSDSPFKFVIAGYYFEVTDSSALNNQAKITVQNGQLQGTDADGEYSGITFQSTRTAGSAADERNVYYINGNDYYLQILDGNNVPVKSRLMFDSSRLGFDNDIMKFAASTTPGGAATTAINAVNATSAGSATTASACTGNSDTATYATNDESGNNIKATYAANISRNGSTIQLLNKNGAAIGNSQTLPDTNTTYTLTVNGNNLVFTPSSGGAVSITVPYATAAGSASSAGSATSATNSTQSTKIGTDSSHPAIGAANRSVYVNGDGAVTAGKTIFVQSTAPAANAAGDIWIVTQS